MTRILLRHFNSTMVRLKGNHPFPIGRRVYIFQFHYGTIKRLGFLNIPRDENSISIPLWYD